MAKDNSPKVMSLIDHLEELRKRLIVCTITVFAMSMAAYAYIDPIRSFFVSPVGDLVYMGLTEAFLTNLKLAFTAGFFLSLPVIFYQIWCFTLPALQKSERFLMFIISFFSLVFFAMGATFGFYVVLPFSVRFFLGFSTDQLQPMLSISGYITYSMGVLLGFGLVFEMPVVTLILTKLGLISANFLAEQRMYSTVIIFVVAAILTPPDVVTQLLMATPMLLLYEISIIIARLVERREKRLVQRSLH